MTRRIMIDIETLDTRPTAAILSIGAVEFSTRPEGGAKFYINVDAAECIDLGMTISLSTVEWWVRHPEAWERVKNNPAPCPVFSALNALWNWISQIDAAAPEIWANSPSFDLAIIEHACALADIYVPWSYRQTRDCRTLRAEAERLGYVDNITTDDLTAHYALDDAVLQARRAVAQMAYLEQRGA